ncbi:MAG: hypothetical protein LBJ08_08060, partial [Bifidobacteriaceae bacterium]|nr:hypothetical protein [Bifidobacteriaceae bacterium]
MPNPAAAGHAISRPPRFGKRAAARWTALAYSLQRTPGLVALIHDNGSAAALSLTRAALERHAPGVPVVAIASRAARSDALRHALDPRRGWDALVLQAGTEVGPGGIARLAA